VLGYKGRFLSTDKRGIMQRNNKILNNTAKLSSRTLASGMMTGITSPARPWFRLAPPDSQLLEDDDVRLWLHTVEHLMREEFNKSNVYNVLHNMYQELGTFGVAPIVGSYCLALDGLNKVDTFYREYSMTAGQVVKRFGIENVSPHTRQLFEKGGSESTVNLLHVVEPNDNRDQTLASVKHNKVIRSLHIEIDCGHYDGFLEETGFDEMPILTPRWEVQEEDPYAVACPAMDCLGDIKALQLEERRKGQALDKVVNPPLQAPSSMSNLIDGGGFQAGEITFVNDLSSGGIRSVYDMRPDLNALSQDILTCEDRIRKSFYNDLFMMLTNSDRRQITAREIEERHEEKLLMLSPVLERLQNELLNPLIDRTFAIMARNEMIPEAPQELQGEKLKVEYISVLAQAQRMTAIGGIERLAGYVTQIAQIDPNAVKKMDFEQSVDIYAEALGVSPKLVRSDDEVDEMVEQEMRQQQMAQMGAMAQPAKDATQAVQQLSETQVNGDPALDQLAGM
jgi:hypothetical protein